MAQRRMEFGGPQGDPGAGVMGLFGRSGNRHAGWSEHTRLSGMLAGKKKKREVGGPHIKGGGNRGRNPVRGSARGDFGRGAREPRGPAGDGESKGTGGEGGGPLVFGRVGWGRWAAPRGANGAGGTRMIRLGPTVRLSGTKGGGGKPQGE